MYLLDYLIDFITLTHEYNKDNPENSINSSFLKKRIAEYILPQDIHKYDESIYCIPEYREDLERRKNEQIFTIAICLSHHRYVRRFYTTNFLSIIHGKPLRVRNICWLATRNWNMEFSCIDYYSRCQY